jgi:hypothetical protein
MDHEHTMAGSGTMSQPEPAALDLESLDDFSEIVVETRNSVYRIRVIDHHRGETLIEGGRFFKEPTRAFLLGRSQDGSFVRLGRLSVGGRLGVVAGGQTLQTSHVCSIRIVPPTGRCDRSLDSSA